MFRQYSPNLEFRVVKPTYMTAAESKGNLTLGTFLQIH